MAKLTDKVMLITGASKGIGLGCALVCLRHGARVAIVARDPDAAQADITTAGFSFTEHVLPLAADVRDAKSMEQAIARTIDSRRCSLLTPESKWSN